LVYILDRNSNRRFLIDTGATYSVFPHRSSSPPSGPRLTGPSGDIIPCWGEKKFSLSFDGEEFTWPLLLADVNFPILGLDFLRHHQLLVDPAANRLVSPPQQLAASALSHVQPDTDGVAVVPTRRVTNRRVSSPQQLAASALSHMQPDTDGVAVVPSWRVTNRRVSSPQQLAASILSCVQPDTTSVAAVHCRPVATADPAGFSSSFHTDEPASTGATISHIAGPVIAGPAIAGGPSAGAASAGPDSFSSSAPWPLQPVSSSPLAMLAPSDDGG